MSVLSTSQKLVRVGKEYSAGNGIEISSYVISYTGDSGQEYIAGENIGINDFVISSRNWTPDITYAAESAFQRATDYTNNQISALSGEVSAEVSQLGSDIDYISGVALTAHQSLDGYLTKASGDEYYQPIGSYVTVSQLENTSGEIVNLIPSIEGLATEEYVNEQTSGKADKSEIPDVSQFITNVSAESTYQPIGNYLSSNALEGYVTQDWVNEQGYITGVDLSNYYTKTDTSSKEELSAAFANLPQGDAEVNSLVHSNSAEWNNVSAKLDTTAYTPFDPSYMSGAIDDKLDTTAFSTVSGDFLTAIPDEYATKDFVSDSITGKLDSTAFSTVSSDFLVASSLNGYATESFVENVSGDITALIPTDYATTSQVNDLSGAIDYVSANAGSTSGYVSGTNVLFVPDYVGSTNGNFYSATISGDVKVATGFYYNGEPQYYKVYSLSAIGEDFDNKLNKSVIDDSNTLAKIDNHAEVTDRAYRRTGFTNISTQQVRFDSYTVSVNFDSFSVPNFKLYSATVTVETTASGSNVPEKWSLVSYENNSAIFTGSFPFDKMSDTFYLVGGGGWGPFTNCEASATVYSALEIAPLAFKDDIPDTSTFYTTAEANTLSSMLSGAIDYVSANVGGEFPASANEAITAYQSNSASYLTAHQDLSAYATTSDLEQVSADITATIPSTAGLASESYVQTNSAVLTAMIAEKQDTLTFGYDEQNKISAINGSALAIGEFVPLSAYNELKQSYDALSSLFATYSGQWLLPNEGV